MSKFAYPEHCSETRKTLQMQHDLLTRFVATVGNGIKPERGKGLVCHSDLVEKQR